MPLQKQIKIPERLVIKQAKLKTENFVLVVISASFIFLFLNNRNLIPSYLLFFMALAYAGFHSFFLIRRSMNQKPQIVIDKNGIMFIEEKRYFPWDQIKYAFVRSLVKSKNNSTYLHIITTEGEASKKINHFDYSAALVKDTIEYYSGRDIAVESNIIRDQIQEVVGAKTSAPDVMQAFYGYYKRQMIVFFMLFLPIMGLSVYGQVRSDFPYFLAFGLLISIVVTGIVREKEEEKFKHYKHIIDLTDEEFDTLAKKYQLKHSGTVIFWRRIFLILLTAAAFYISYYQTIP